jgi:hypothetical protein
VAEQGVHGQNDYYMGREQEQKISNGWTKSWSGVLKGKSAQREEELESGE